MPDAAGQDIGPQTGKVGNDADHPWRDDILLNEKLPVLDKGYVRLAETNLLAAVKGGDLSTVNAARASYMKESKELRDRDVRLIRFLAEHGHMSPFRHATLTLEIKAPLMVARQWFKYRVGSVHGPDTAELVGIAVPEELQEPFWDYVRRALDWLPHGDDQGFSDLMFSRNEASRRYITLEPEFYVPAAAQWREAPENSKQGSGGPVPEDVGREATARLLRQIEAGMADFNWAMENGIAAEQARGFIPAMYFMYTVWRWTCSLEAACHFVHQRVILDGAQHEITEYGQRVMEIILDIFPHSAGKLLGR